MLSPLSRRRRPIVVFLGIFVAVFVSINATSAQHASDVCLVLSVTDSVLGFQDYSTISLSRGGGGAYYYYSNVVEGNDTSLQRALNLIHENSNEYVAVLFYASWCPFSRTCRLSFAMLSSLFPSIRHFSIEESVIKPSLLSRYGVHGFPTLFLLHAKSTTRIRYQGSRTLSSLISFYSDVTGLEPLSLDQSYLEKMRIPLNCAEVGDSEQENCPFSWARSPENILRQETYLALATAFVLLRLIYLLPMLYAYACSAWRRHIWYGSLMSLWEHPLAHIRRAMQVFTALKERCKRSNLQEGAMNARAWASKSLASVTISDASSSRGCTSN